MKVKYSLHNIAFEWDSQKAASNLHKHGVTFELACESFFDPFVCYLADESVGGELRETIIGLSTNWQLLYVIYVMRNDIIRIISARLVTTTEREKTMKTNKLAQRLRRDRQMTMVSIRIPDDVIDDLKRVAPLLGFSGYQALIKAYIGQGLRTDLERFESSVELSALIESLRKKGVKDEIISSAMAEAQNSSQAA